MKKALVSLAHLVKETLFLTTYLFPCTPVWLVTASSGGSYTMEIGTWGFMAPEVMEGRAYTFGGPPLAIEALASWIFTYQILNMKSCKHA